MKSFKVSIFTFMMFITCILSLKFKVQVQVLFKKFFQFKVKILFQLQKMFVISWIEIKIQLQMPQGLLFPTQEDLIQVCHLLLRGTEREIVLDLLHLAMGRKDKQDHSHTKARIGMWLLKLFLLHVDDDCKENPRHIL